MTHDPVFPDKSAMPTDADLTRVLGRKKGHWDKLMASAMKAAPDATPECKYYTKKSGWTFLLRGKRRNVLYMRPIEKGRFVAAFVFGEKAVQAAEQADLPTEVIEMIRQSPKYPEGRAVRLEVGVAADVKIAKKLLAIKLAN